MVFMTKVFLIFLHVSALSNITTNMLWPSSQVVENYTFQNKSCSAHAPLLTSVMALAWLAVSVKIQQQPGSQALHLY